MNGDDVRPAPNEAFEMVVAVASGELREVPEIAAILARWRAPA
jgi:hypothetical protein